MAGGVDPSMIIMAVLAAIEGIVKMNEMDFLVDLGDQISDGGGTCYVIEFLDDGIIIEKNGAFFKVSAVEINYCIND
jgi:hypothetical protein